MPTIGDLGGVRECLRDSFAVGATAISRDDLYIRTQCQPGLRGRPLPIRQQRRDTTALQVTDNSAVPVIAPIRPVVDANDAQGLWRLQASPPHNAQQGVLANQQHQPLGEDLADPGLHMPRTLRTPFADVSQHPVELSRCRL